MKKVLLSVIVALFLSLPAFADAKAVRQVVVDLHQNIIAGNFQNILKYYHYKYTGTASDGSEVSINNIRSLVNMQKRFAKAVAPDSKLIDIVEFYAFIRRTPLSAKDRKDVLTIQDSDIGKTRADVLRKELKQVWDTQFQKLAASWKTYKVVSVTVNGVKAVIVFEMVSVNGKKEEHKLELIKFRGSWLILKSTIKPVQAAK